MSDQMSEQHYGRTPAHPRGPAPPRPQADRRRSTACSPTPRSADGREPLSDQHRLDLLAGGGDGFAAVVASDDGRLTGYAQVSHGNCSSTVGLVVDPAHRGEQAALGTELMATALDVVRAAGGGPVHWWVFDPTFRDEELAGRLGLTVGRELLQMRRGLPTDLPYSVTHAAPSCPGRTRRRGSR